MLSDGSRKIEIDKEVANDISKGNFDNTTFTRLKALGRTFSGVSFKHCIFDNCYLRNCSFINCDFTGAKFSSTQLPKSTFTNPTFDYATFDKTFIQDDILSDCCPAYNNLKADFARSLRVNYTQLGLAESANKAISVELKAKKQHLLDSWQSNTSYYRLKYKSWARVAAFISYLQFWILDFVWGNGESPFRLCRSIAGFAAALSVYNFFIFKLDAWGSISSSIMSLIISRYPSNYPDFPTFFSGVIRIILFAMLTSMIFRRLSRR